MAFLAPAWSGLFFRQDAESFTELARREARVGNLGRQMRVPRLKPEDAFLGTTGPALADWETV
jgi:hypothetical protein